MPPSTSPLIVTGPASSQRLLQILAKRGEPTAPTRNAAGFLQGGTPREPKRTADALAEPAAKAENYWQLYRQPRAAWALRLDMRP